MNKIQLPLDLLTLERDDLSPLFQTATRRAASVKKRPRRQAAAKRKR